MKVVTDAGNWTAAALGSNGRPARNDESVLFIDSSRLDGNVTGQRYLSNYLELIRKYGHQQAATEPSAEALVSRLQALPTWPKVKVNFEVFAETFYGQDVFITGNHPALGDWTRQGPGLRLRTDGASYPTWKTDAALELPFGTSLEFKLIKRDGHGNVVWDGGPNQLLVADPGDRRTPGARDGALVVNDRF